MDLGDWRSEKATAAAAVVGRGRSTSSRGTRPSRRWHESSRYEPAAPIVRTRQSAEEREKAAKLREELRQAMREPLNPGGELHHSTRKRIRERVQDGLRQQKAYWLMGPRQKRAQP